jgi:hypothetical protein
MMLPEIKNKKREPKKLTKAVISDKVNDSGNEPFFVKRAKLSKDFLEKWFS